MWSAIKQNSLGVSVRKITYSSNKVLGRIFYTIRHVVVLSRQLVTSCNECFIISMVFSKKKVNIFWQAQTHYDFGPSKSKPKTQNKITNEQKLFFWERFHLHIKIIIALLLIKWNAKNWTIRMKNYKTISIRIFTRQ